MKYREEEKRKMKNEREKINSVSLISQYTENEKLIRSIYLKEADATTVLLPIRRVWFQNRRAKWRRQEKLENTAALRLHDLESGSSESSMRGDARGSVAFLPVDPWFTPPVFSSAMTHSVPSFMTASSYPGFLHQPITISAGPRIKSPTLTSPLLLAHTARDLTIPKMMGNNPDPRNNSIVSLRLKAREHLDIMHKIDLPTSLI
ncbi:Retinal homeobox protein Rx1 [Nymphon striatum]|nr:Retinal homeobox protein Rx1 [Nymphon striatum]